MLTIFLWGQSGPKKSRKGKERAARPSSAEVPAAVNYFHSAPHQPPRQPVGPQDEESDSDSTASSGSSAPPAPLKQEISLTGSDPLPKSLHSNLPSLLTHPTSPLRSASGQPLLKALRSANLLSLWGVQCAVAGTLLDGRDTMCIAPTGSGKTLSYLLPTMVLLGDPARTLREPRVAGSGKKGVGEKEQSVIDSALGIRALVCVPTHDLAIQIQAVLKVLSQGREWRTIVLSKATEKAVIESSPGRTATRNTETDEEGSDPLDNDAASGSGHADDEVRTQRQEKADPLGIDFLIVTPGRLHLLVESNAIDLSQ